MKYRVVITLELSDPLGQVDETDIAEHCAVACAQWGGQYHPDDPLFSANVEATAKCRGATYSTKDD